MTRPPELISVNKGSLLPFPIKYFFVRFQNLVASFISVSNLAIAHVHGSCTFTYIICIDEWGRGMQACEHTMYDEFKHGHPEDKVCGVFYGRGAFVMSKYAAVNSKFL